MLDTCRSVPGLAEAPRKGSRTLNRQLPPSSQTPDTPAKNALLGARKGAAPPAAPPPGTTAQRRLAEPP
jgi:hypothetical protein